MEDEWDDSRTPPPVFKLNYLGHPIINTATVYELGLEISEVKTEK